MFSTMRFRRLALLVTVLLSSVTTAETKTYFQVTALGYRVIPHYKTKTQQIAGTSRTTCYGAGVYSAIVRLGVTCSTVSTMPENKTDTSISQIEILNEVESGGMVYTIRCTANWSGSNCSHLIPGDVYNVEVEKTTMWIHARQGGNLGKAIKPKFQMLDMRPITSNRAAIANVPTAPAPLPGLEVPNVPSSTPASLTNLLPVPKPDSAASSTPATIWLYRTKSATDSMLNPTIYSQGKALAKLEKGQFFALVVPAGTYRFSWTDNPKQKEEAWITVIPGKLAFLKVRYREIQPVPFEEAIKDFKSLKAIESQNVHSPEVLTKSP